MTSASVGSLHAAEPVALGLELDRRLVADRGVRAAAVVDDLDEANQPMPMSQKYPVPLMGCSPNITDANWSLRGHP